MATVDELTRENNELKQINRSLEDRLQKCEDRVLRCEMTVNRLVDEVAHHQKIAHHQNALIGALQTRTTQLSEIIKLQQTEIDSLKH